MLFFDYWTKGLLHFTKLTDKIGDRAQCVLFHFGSWRDRSVPRAQRISGIDCVDITSFPGLNLEAILSQLRPSVLVALNMHLLLDRAVFLSCRKLGIPTVFLQHGAWSEPDKIREVSELVDRGFTIMDRVRRIPRYLRIIPWYLRARGRVLDPTPWRVIWGLTLHPRVNQFFPIAGEELWPTRALVFNEGSRQTVIENHGMPPDKVIVIGNPELDPAIARRDRPLDPRSRAEIMGRLKLDPAQPIVCFLMDGFAEQQNAFGWTTQLQLARIAELHAACRAEGAQLLVRPHPATNLAKIEQLLAGYSGISINRSVPLLDSIEVSRAVVGAITTSMETAFVLGRPLLVPTWHINDQDELSPYLQYEAAEPVRTPSELPEAIRQALNGRFPARDTSEFVIRRLGRVDGSAAARGAAVVLELAREARTLQAQI